MSISATVSITFQRSSEAITKQVTLTADEEFNIDSAVAHSVTNQAYAFAITKAKIQWLELVAEGVGLTVKTNSSGSPVETIALAVNVPYLWYAGSGVPNPLVGDLTNLFATNADGVIDATLRVRCGYNR